MEKVRERESSPPDFFVLFWSSLLLPLSEIKNGPFALSLSLLCLVLFTP